MIHPNARAPSVRTTGHSTYVLVHGAWFGGWVWKPVAERLRAAGHRVYAPTLTGLGERSHLLHSEISLDTHADDIVNVIQMEDLEGVVLVGWSYGGMVTTEVLARIPGRIASMVYLDAFVPKIGHSAASYSRRNNPELVTQLVAQGQHLPPPSVSALGVTDPLLIQHATERLSSHPARTFLQPSGALPHAPDIPQTFVLAKEYALISPTFKTFYEDFSKDPTAIAIAADVGHVMMLTHTIATVDLLTNLH